MEFFPGMAVPGSREGRAARLGARRAAASISTWSAPASTSPGCAPRDCAGTGTRRAGIARMTRFARVAVLVQRAPRSALALSTRGCCACSPAPRSRWPRWRATCSACTGTWRSGAGAAERRWAVLRVRQRRLPAGASDARLLALFARGIWPPRRCTSVEQFTARVRTALVAVPGGDHGAGRRRRARGADPGAARLGGRRCGGGGARGAVQPDRRGRQRATGPMDDPNDLAYVLVAALPLLVALTPRAQPATASCSRARALAVLVLVAGAAATFSRGGPLALVLRGRLSRAAPGVALRALAGVAAVAVLRARRGAVRRAGAGAGARGEDLYRGVQCGHTRAALAGGRADAGREPGARGRARRIPQRVRRSVAQRRDRRADTGGAQHVPGGRPRSSACPASSVPRRWSRGLWRANACCASVPTGRPDGRRPGPAGRGWSRRPSCPSSTTCPCGRWSPSRSRPTCAVEETR